MVVKTMIKFNGGQVTVDEDTYNYLKSIADAGNPFVLQMARAFSYLKPVDFENMTTDQYRSFTDELIVFLSGNYEGISVAEKKYKWKYKKTDVGGYYHHLYRRTGLIELGYVIDPTPFTEKQVIEAGYNLDMYEREEVE